MAETRTWDAPVFLYTLGPYLLQGFPHVLNVTTEPFLGLLHSHTLYYTPTNTLDITFHPILLRFARLLVGKIGSLRVGETRQATFVMESGENVFWTYLGYWRSSDGGGVEDLSWKQLVRETTH
jgi:hypothetical protein